MSNSRCTSCGLIHQRGQCPQQTSTTSPDGPIDITPTFCCTCYFVTIAFFVVFFLVVTGLSKVHVSNRSCYVEIFANSISVSNASENVSAADWRIGFVAKSPITDFKISLHTLTWRLLRGNELISSSSSPLSDYFGQSIAGGKTSVVFEKVVMPKVINDVIWDFRVEIVSAVNTDSIYVNGFVMAACPNIPVKFTTDPAGKVMGSLLGNMRRCDYEFRNYLDSSV